MTDYTDFLIGEKVQHRINAVIKILKDSVNKDEYRKQSEHMEDHAIIR